MQPTALLASIALMAAAISTPLLAGDREHEQRHDRQQTTEKRASDGSNGFDHGMQTVVHEASADAPGHGWRYFSDPTKRLSGRASQRLWHAALSHLKTVAEQLPRADRWTVFPDDVVSKITRPLPPWQATEEIRLFLD